MTDLAISGCPVMHHDFSPQREAGSHWELARELRETCPVFFNSYAQGYWVFTRHEAVREIYKNPDIFSSESITPWQPDPIYRLVPTQIDAPDHIKYRRVLNPWFSPRAMDAAEPLIRDLCRGLVEQAAPRGRTDFVAEFGLRYPTEVFLGVIGVDPADADLFVPWVEDFFRGFGGDPAGLEPMAAALERDPRILGGHARRAARRSGAARGRSRFPSPARHVRRPPADRRRAARHAHRARAGRPRHDTRRARLHVPPPRDAPRGPPAADRRAGADPVGGRGGPALLHDHLRRRPQGDA